MSIKYLTYYQNKVIDNNILLEGGQGKNINGNMFYFVRELCTNSKWNQMKVYFVVTKETKLAAQEKMSFYNYKNINYVVRESDEYMKLLATCKYLVTDNSFPPYFIKKENQVYLNTWHGTPLKILGRKDFNNSKISFGNIQKNYAMADYALFPNTYTRDVFLEDYCLKNIIKQNIVLTDYPRNTAFFNEDLRNQIIQDLALDGKQLLAYMPTWRGTSRNANIDAQKETTIKILEDLDERLSDDQILFINLHFLIGNSIDISHLKHVQMFPKQYETYDFLNVCDSLITDYSSVFFDFAVTGRKIILYAYDLEEYMADRGTYFPIEDLPFPLVTTCEDVIKEINNPIVTNYDDFRQTYCKYASKDITNLLLELMVHKNKRSLHIEPFTYNEKENEVILVDNLNTMNQKALLLDYLSNCKEDKNYILCISGKRSDAILDVVAKMPRYIQLLCLVGKNLFDKQERITIKLSVRIRLLEKLFSKRLNKTYQRETLRKFYHLRIHSIIDFYNNSRYLTHEVVNLDCKKTYLTLNPIYYGLDMYKRTIHNTMRYKSQNYDMEQNYNKCVYEECNKYDISNYCYRFIRIQGRTYEKKDYIVCSMTFLMKGIHNLAFDQVKIQVGKEIYETSFSFTKGIKVFKNYYFNHVKFYLDREAVINLPIQNKISFVSFDKDEPFQIRVVYSIFSKVFKKILNKRSNITKIDDKLCCYFRQSLRNGLYLTVRPYNKADSKLENFKINISYYLASFMPQKSIMLLFEKNSSRYEESASVVYENLINRGYKDAYFILDRNYPQINEINPKYRKNIIYKYSLKHYLYFFRSQTFLGTEALIHSLELRNANQHVLKKVNDLKNNYIFLQHGVMYMISLDSESRTFFQPKKVNGAGKFGVVVSSQAEANHFIELGGYDESQVIVCGLPKFDRSYRVDDAEKIVIMPTWRPWEYNEATEDFTETKYYRFMSRIFHAIPKQYHDKVIILPHPLFVESAKDSEFDLKKYMLFEVKYDHILQHTRLLITDYSSIAYDAFYRGCNIMFCWEELQYCLENYGPSTKLMLNESNVFGKICYNTNDITDNFEMIYFNEQQEQYIKNYQKIVTYHDGNNTKRLIQFLKENKILK